LFHVAEHEDDIVICALCTAARNNRLSLSTTSLSGFHSIKARN